MITRRAALAGATALLLPNDARAAASYQPLFRIERSKNANIVQYDAVVTGPAQLDPRGPVIAYWVLLAEDGRREGLGVLDRRAYGFEVAPERGGSWLVYLHATSDRSLRVLSWQGRWVAQVVIAGRSAVLNHIFVATDESGLVPSVRWIDLFGTDMVDGKALTERLRPR